MTPEQIEDLEYLIDDPDWNTGQRELAWKLLWDIRDELVSLRSPAPACDVCGKTDDPTIERRHRNTMFVNDELNYLVSCQSCFDDDWAYYQERWDDYYSDIYAGLYGH